MRLFTVQTHRPILLVHGLQSQSAHTNHKLTLYEYPVPADTEIWDSLTEILQSCIFGNSDCVWKP
jgi:hypothetical protein